VTCSSRSWVSGPSVYQAIAKLNGLLFHLYISEINSCSILKEKQGRKEEGENRREREKEGMTINPESQG